jgi:hypothetical protein
MKPLPPITTPGKGVDFFYGSAISPAESTFKSSLLRGIKPIRLFMLLLERNLVTIQIRN